MPVVSTKHPDLAEREKQYRLINDVLMGEQQIKYRKEAYLPNPSSDLLLTGKPEDQEYALKRYAEYLSRSVFYNVAERTMRGMVGQIFSRQPQLDVPSDLKAFVDNIDGAGVAFAQQAKLVSGCALSKGRAGLLTDYTNTSGAGATAEQIAIGEARPTIRFYNESQIVNWDYIQLGSQKKLSFVVLEETVNKRAEFAVSKVKQWRVLLLNDLGKYEQKLYRADNSVAEVLLIKGNDGNALDDIPFEFIGSESNDGNIDYCPLYPIASLNIAHYRNSADYEESLFYTGQPTPVVTGLTETWLKNILNGRIVLGSRVAVALPSGAKMELVQAAPNMLAKEGMDQKEKQMVALGARLVESKSVQRTATEASQDEAQEKSQLATIAENTSQAYTRSITMMQRFTGGSGKVYVALNTEFELQRLTAEERKQTILEWQAEGITTSEMRQNLRRGGVAFEDDATYLASIQKDRELFDPLEDGATPNNTPTDPPRAE